MQRAEDPVAVQLELTPERVSQLRERLLVAALGPREPTQIHEVVHLPARTPQHTQIHR